MDTIEEEKRKIKARRKDFFKDSNNDNGGDEKQKHYVNNLITRLLVSIIVFFGVIIAANFNAHVNKFVDENVLKDNMSFSKISALYNKYFGNIVPLQNLSNDDKTVFNEKLIYEEIKNYQDGYELLVSKNYLVPVINSGIIVFIGEKEGLGDTVIIQGIDGIDYWYSNVSNLSANLYDYVSKGDYLGNVKDDKLLLTFKKENEFLEYDEVVK